MYPIYEEVKREEDVILHRLAGFDTLDLSEAFNT